MDERTVARFWSKVNIGEPADCWTWKLDGGIGGYGQFSIGGKGYYAHRISYEIAKGPIPAGLHIDHLCRVRNCVNPKHLEAVTRKENLRRAKAWEGGAAFQRNKTHCSEGHPYEGYNLFIARTGQRVCRACARRNSQASRARKAEREGPKVRKRRTHCNKGHAYAEHGYTNETGGQVCRICAKERLRQSRANRKALEPPKEPARTCKNGHEWTDENTYVSPSTGFRACRACHNERTLAEYYARKAAAPPRPPRTHCKNGHELTEANTYTAPDGREYCRSCAADRRQAYEQKRAVEQPALF
jgi:hypothetical protein